MLRKRSYPALWILSFLLIEGCHSGKKAPDVSHIPISVHIERFDQEFMRLNPDHLDSGLSHLEKNYPEFFPVYMNQIMNFVSPTDSGWSKRDIKAFITSKDIQKLQDTIDAHFPPTKIQQINRQLDQSFRYIKYYLPSFHPPRVVTFMSALANYGAITVDSVLGIGLDMFLGAGFPLYRQVVNPYPAYILKSFSANQLVVSCIKVIEQQLFPIEEKGTLLDQMTAYGKQLYFLDKILPETKDALKIGYSEKQLQWCKKNEQFIWQYFIRNNLLYENDPLTIRYYIGPGPSSRGMPLEAPGNIGSWIGWQIIRKYMEKYPGTSLPELMKLPDGQKLLSKSGYRPH